MSFVATDIDIVNLPERACGAPSEGCDSGAPLPLSGGAMGKSYLAWLRKRLVAALGAGFSGGLPPRDAELMRDAASRAVCCRKGNASPHSRGAFPRVRAAAPAAAGTPVAPHGDAACSRTTPPLLLASRALRPRMATVPLSLRPNNKFRSSLSRVVLQTGVRAQRPQPWTWKCAAPTFAPACPSSDSRAWCVAAAH